MAESADTILIRKARALRQSSLADWNEFMAAMKIYLDDRCQRVLTASTTDQLIDFKGQASGIKWLLQLLEGAAKAEKSNG